MRKEFPRRAATIVVINEKVASPITRKTSAHVCKLEKLSLSRRNCLDRRPENWRPMVFYSRETLRGGLLELARGSSTSNTRRSTAISKLSPDA